MDLDIVIVVEGHAPEAVVFRLARSAELVPQLVGGLCTCKIERLQYTEDSLQSKRLQRAHQGRRLWHYERFLERNGRMHQNAHTRSALRRRSASGVCIPWTYNRWRLFIFSLRINSYA